MNKKITKLLIMLLQWLQDWAYDWYDWAWDKKNELYDSLDEPPTEYQDAEWIPRNITVKATIYKPESVLYHPEEKVSDKPNWGRSPIEHLITEQINVNGGENDGNRGNRGNRGNQSNTDIRENS